MRALLSLALLVTACAPAAQETQSVTAAPQALMTWPDLLGRPTVEPTTRIAYGALPQQLGELWLPDGAGPHPVVLMVHGGCWQKEIADLSLMNWAAEDLRKRGFAVWNIEYRGVDEDGGGYPGTFTDVAAAADKLREIAPQHSLDLARIAAFGHSAGGHLATWLAARPNLPAASPLRTADPLPLRGVVNSGGLADLAASKPVTQAECLANIMDMLTGAPSPERPNVLSDTSPAEMLPLRVRLVSVNGDKDRIAPAVLGEGLTARAKAAGDRAETVIVPDTGHVELVSPGTQAFDVQAKLLADLLR